MKQRVLLLVVFLFSFLISFSQTNNDIDSDGILDASDNCKYIYNPKQEDLDKKTSELDAIISETKIDEDRLLKASLDAKKNIESRLVSAYTRLRENAKNGLAVVQVVRGSCGGCFNKIPPQRQLDIVTKKKIIVCEYCGRILVPFEEA